MMIIIIIIIKLIIIIMTAVNLILKTLLEIFYYSSLRAKFLIPGTTLIQLHGSLNENLAERETRWFFPMEQVLLLVKPVAFNLKGKPQIVT